jgi:23S rRNA (pseudouridine1915-N3)-methyltransferase
MKIVLYNIGKTDVPYLKEGVDDYCNRIRHFIDFSVVDLPLVKHGKSLTPELLCAKEGELISKAVAKSNIVALLDERGKEYSSRALAEWLRKLFDQGVRQLSFVTGGAYGFSPTVHDLADYKLSLSKMTFTHQMVRLIFTEQLYRAMTIIKGIPYHNE